MFNKHLQTNILGEASTQEVDEENKVELPKIENVNDVNIKLENVAA